MQELFSYVTFGPAAPVCKHRVCLPVTLDRAEGDKGRDGFNMWRGITSTDALVGRDKNLRPECLTSGPGYSVCTHWSIKEIELNRFTPFSFESRQNCQIFFLCDNYDPS